MVLPPLSGRDDLSAIPEDSPGHPLLRADEARRTDIQTRPVRDADTSPPGIVPESAGPTRYRSGEWFESRNSPVRSVEVSGQLSNQNIREEIETLWALTRHSD